MKNIACLATSVFFLETKLLVYNEYCTLNVTTNTWKPAAVESLVSPGLLPMGSDIQRPLVLRSSRPDWERNVITWVGEVHCLGQSHNIIFGFPFHTYQVGEVSQRNCPGGRPVGDPSLQCFLVGRFPEKGKTLKEPDKVQQICGSQLNASGDTAVIAPRQIPDPLQCKIIFNRYLDNSRSKSKD